MHAQAAEIAQAEGGDAMNHAYEGDLHLIMMAVQKLVDEIIRPDELGHEGQEDSRARAKRQSGQYARNEGHDG